MGRLGSEPPAVGSRRYYWCKVVDDHRVLFDASEAHHLERVMRHGAGAEVWAVDGSGRRFSVGLERGAEGLGGRILETHAEQDAGGVRLWLGCAVIRPQRFDWLIEKATELGVDEIQPLETERSLALGGSGRTARGRRIARAASLQSLRTRVPQLHEPERVEALDWSRFEDLWMAHPAGGPTPNVTGQTLAAVVGPEGGWSGRELELFERAGATQISLGPQRLRTETAALALLARVPRVR